MEDDVNGADLRDVLEHVREKRRNMEMMEAITFLQEIIERLTNDIEQLAIDRKDSCDV
jgi:hypothetical protein